MTDLSSRPPSICFSAVRPARPAMRSTWPSSAGLGKADALEFVTGDSARKKERQDEEAIEAVLKRAVPIAGTRAEGYLRPRGATRGAG